MAIRIYKLLTRIQVESFWRQRRFWLALLGLLLFSLFASLSFLSKDVDTEWGIALDRVGESLRVEWIQPSGVAWDGGVRPGDSIVEVNGLPTTGGRIPSTAPWMSLTVISSADGALFVTTAPPPLSVSLALVLLASGLMFLIIGTSVLLWAPDLEQALAFYAFSFSTAVVLVLAISEPSGQLWNVRLLYGFTMLALSSLAYFFLVFPKSRLGKRSSVSYLLLFSPVVALIPLFLLSSFQWQSLYEIVRPVTYVSYGLLSLTAAGAFLASFVDSWRETFTQQLWLPIVGTLVAIIGIVLTTILPLSIARDPLVAPQIGLLFAVLVPASFAYAILRHRLMGFSGIIRRALISFFVGVLLLASFVIVSMLVKRALGPNLAGDMLNLALELLFIGAALVVLPALHHSIQRFVDRVFFKEVYQYDQALQSAHRSLTSTRSADQLASEVITIIARALNLSYAAVVLRDVGGSPQVIASTDKSREDIIDDILAAADAIGRGAGVMARAGKASGLNITYLPLLAAGGNVGLLCLGPKESGLGFGERDTNLLKSVATQLAMGLDNARLLQTVQRNFADLQASAAKLRELNHRLLMSEEQERRRLAADLHDEPLQRIMLLLRNVEGCHNKYGNGAMTCKNLAEEAAAALRRVCVDFHPPLLEDLGLAPALEWLVSNVNKSSSVDVRIEVDPDFGAAPLRPETQIALYRIVQESLNNAIRHSEAATVLVQLVADDGAVFVSVKDDGKGFRLPDSLSNLSLDGHLGLIGMSERMESAGGRLEIDTAPGCGTEVLAIVNYATNGGSRPETKIPFGATAIDV